MALRASRSSPRGASIRRGRPAASTSGRVVGSATRPSSTRATRGASSGRRHAEHEAAMSGEGAPALHEQLTRREARRDRLRRGRFSPPLGSTRRGARDRDLGRGRLTASTADNLAQSTTRPSLERAAHGANRAPARGGARRGRSGAGGSPRRRRTTWSRARRGHLRRGRPRRQQGTSARRSTTRPLRRGRPVPPGAIDPMRNTMRPPPARTLGPPPGATRCEARDRDLRRRWPTASTADNPVPSTTRPSPARAADGADRGAALRNTTRPHFRRGRPTAPTTGPRGAEHETAVSGEGGSRRRRRKRDASPRRPYQTRAAHGANNRPTRGGARNGGLRRGRPVPPEAADAMRSTKPPP